MDRSIAPPLNKVTVDRFPNFEHRVLSGGINAYRIESGVEEVVKVEIQLPAGRWYEDRKLAARTTAMMLREGTQNRSAADIAELIDFYGATFRIEDGFDHCSILMYCLSKDLADLTPLLRELLTAPAFNASELEHYVARAKQRLLIDLEKIDIMAYRIFTEALYGDKHPYGYNSAAPEYESLQVADLRNHFDKAWHQQGVNLFIAGNARPEMTDLIMNEVISHMPAGKARLAPDWQLIPRPEKQIIIEKPDSMQSAIRIGKRLFSRTHEDYPGLYILNTVLGGYFGSRLIQNLREDKGLTYGAYSAVDTLMHDGFFYISTEVDRVNRQLAVDEIFNEVRRIREQPIEKDELQMLRNYLMGNVMRALDGAFNVSDLIRDLDNFNHTPADFLDYVRLINDITPEQLQALAQQYLNPDDMLTVVVG